VKLENLFFFVLAVFIGIYKSRREGIDRKYIHAHGCQAPHTSKEKRVKNLNSFGSSR
jgi:hypothetical protein